MDVDEHGAAAAERGAPATATPPRRSWAVVNRDSPYEQTVLVTRWRSYAAWWTAWLRIFDGADYKIVRRG